MNGVRWAWSGFHTLLSGCKDSGQVDRVPDSWTACLMSRVVLKEGFLASNIHSTQPKESIGRCGDRAHATFLKSLCQLKSENYWFKGTQVLYQEVGPLENCILGTGTLSMGNTVIKNIGLQAYS